MKDLVLKRRRLRRQRGARRGALALVLLVWLGGCTQESSAPAHSGAATAIPVIAVPVRSEPEASRIEAVGTSRAVRSVAMHPEASGEIVAVNFEGGERVAEGDLLVALDARDQKLAVELAEVTLADARVLFRRYEEARGMDAVPPTTLDAARTAMEQARIELDRARVDLDRRFLRAPFAGAVGLTDVEPGDRVEPTTPITTLDDRSALLVFFEVPEAFVRRLEIGDVIEVQSWTADRLEASGPVISLGSRIDPVSRSFTVRARLPNDDDRLRPGMSFRVELDLDGAVWPVVPEVALQWGASGPYVWAVREGRADRVDARVVQRRQGRVLVDAALADGERVVAEGVQRMRQGTLVRALDADALARDARAVLGQEAAARAGAE
ncbi:MAG: efflux RND transporter periplasmic adaptor subunit [Pseudomonadales bacterium]